MEKSIEKLVAELLQLKTLGVVGIKQSFEDEGVSIQDLIYMRRVTQLCGLQMYVKIGGCEAKTDMRNCRNLGVENIIAPMVETKFALKKFLDNAKHIDNTKFHFVCQSKTAISNLEDMLNYYDIELITSVIIGRSDLTKSYQLEKSQTDSQFISDTTFNALSIVKSHNKLCTIGGNMSTKSINFILHAHNSGILDKIETRNIVLDLSAVNYDNINDILTKIINFEVSILQFKYTLSQKQQAQYLQRITTLKNRI